MSLPWAPQTNPAPIGITRNPWDTTCIPGGSSGGSAAAVAARQATATLGTDTGGSIRQPASHCGCVGLKPTYGRVSRYGVIAYASSLDQVGPLTRDVADCAIMLEALAGHDPKDSTSVDTPVPDYSASLKQGVKGLKIGLPKEYFIAGLDPDVQKAMDAAIETYRRLGAEFVDISLPHTDYAVATYYLIATAEASSNLARYDGVRFGHRAEADGLLEMYTKSRSEGFGSEVKRRIMLGTYALSSGYYDAYYVKAQKVRTLIMNDFIGGICRCRCHADSGSSDPGLQDRRKNQRSAADVPVRYFHDPGQPGRHLRHVAPGRFFSFRSSDRSAIDRQAVRRGDHPAGRLCF